MDLQQAHGDTPPDPHSEESSASNVKRRMSRSPSVDLVKRRKVSIGSSERYPASLPAPLLGLSEGQMLQLLRDPHCERCGKLSNQIMQSQAPSPWNLGPGPHGVRIIWPFAERLCGQCFADFTVKVAHRTFFFNISSSMLIL